jgi:hypothetical protein
MIEFARSPSVVWSASQILKLAKDPTWPNNDIVKDKIVLIGASYGGQDLKETPLGKRSGIYNIAAVIETELNGGGIKQPGELAFLPLWIVQGVALIVLFQFFPLRGAFWKNLGWSVALAVGSAGLCSLIASLVSSGASPKVVLVYLAYFLPVGVLVFFEQLREMLNDWRRQKIGQVTREVSDGRSSVENTQK